MTEQHNEQNSSNQERTSGRKYHGVIISAVLITLSVLALVFVANSKLMARTASDSEYLPALNRGSCCSFGNGAGEDSSSLLAQQTLDYYSSSGGDITGMQAIVEDYGCHQEIALLKNGELIKRYSYSGGSFFDITP